MDPTAVNINVTIDDWASVLNYSINASESDWQTPDPSSPTFNASASPWLDGTYHFTNTVNASVSLDFQGPAIYIFGASGPSWGSYAVSIDGSESTYSAYSSTNATNPHLLYGSPNLTYANHSLVIRNLGAAQASDEGASSFLLDYIETTVQLAPAGASVTNTTVEDNSPEVIYNGTWASNTSPLFSGGTSTYTNDSGAAVTFSFSGSAVYIFGDKVNNHGFYSVVLDGGPPEIHNGVSGCSGVYGRTCEKTSPDLAYFASNLGAGQHTVSITNQGGVNSSFFDLDRFVYTTPSVYAPRVLSSNSSSSPFTNGSSTTGSSSPAASTMPKTSSASSAFVQPGNTLLLYIFGAAWLMRKCQSLF